MSDNELDELLVQLKTVCKKNRHVCSNETNLSNVLKKIDVFINRRQMKILSNQKRLDELQRDLLLRECESTQSRAALQEKDLEVNQLHMMLNRAEQTSRDIMLKCDNDVQKLTEELTTVQKEYERLRTIRKKNQDDNSRETSPELCRLREFTKMLETDNQRLYDENDQLRSNENISKQKFVDLREKHNHLEKLIGSLQHHNPPKLSTTTEQHINQSVFECKSKGLNDEIVFYKHRAEQQEIEIRRVEKVLECEREQHKADLQNCRRDAVSDDSDRLRSALINSEYQCSLLRLELKQAQTEKEILKVRLMTEGNTSELSSTSPQLTPSKSNDYEKFIRDELQINFEQANKLISYWNCHKQLLEEKIRQLKRENRVHNANDSSKQICQYNENILHGKRELNRLQMELTDKNTTIFNLHKKIACLDQALTMSNQRMNAQLAEIEDLRTRNQAVVSSTTVTPLMKHLPSDLNKNLRTSSPVRSVDIHKHFYNFDGDVSSSIRVVDITR